jgi:hypothetical protein
VAAALGHLPSLTFIDSVRFLGPLAGAYLLALFAADAASASNARLGRAIIGENRRLHVKALIEAADDVSGKTKAQRWQGYAVQLILVSIAAPAAIVAGVFAVVGDEAFSTWNFAVVTGYFAGYTLLATVVLVLARIQWSRKDRIGASYWIALFVVSLGSVAAMAWLVQLANTPEDTRAVIQRLSITLGVTTLWFLMCASIAWRVPFSSRRGLGAAALIRILRSTARREEAQASFDIPWRRWGLLAFCVLAPPVGLYLTPRARRGERDRHQSDGAVKVGANAALLGTGYLSLASWLVVLGVFYAINPSFG